MEKYLEALPEGISLRIFKNDQLLFESSGKWLHPLFDAETFFKKNPPLLKEGDILSSHDSAIGKAAALLTIRLGITKIKSELLSQLAVDYVEELNKSRKNKIQITGTNLIPRLMCQTEEELSLLHDSDQMYFLLRQRAHLVQGVDVSVKNLCYKFGQIKNLNFELKSGGHLMVVGQNGAGKTTLLRLLNGTYKPLSGQILIDKKEISALEKYTIGYIPQTNDSSQFSLSVEEVISLGIPRAKKNKKEIIKEALSRTCSLNLAQRNFNSLSGGEKQKISLARCLAQRAKLLLLDEPTAALDKENKKMVIDILRSLTISEIPTIIVVTHDQELAALPGWKTLQLGQEEGL